MEISIRVPDDVARLLRERWGDLSERTLEAVAAEAYREGVLTSAEVGRMLGHDSRWETHKFLKRVGAHLDYTRDDLERDTESIDDVLGD